MLIHICCSVDSHYFLQQLKKDYPDEILIGFFYDPNIHPYSEYLLRLEDVKYSCTKLGIELLEGDYDINSWLEAVKGLEDAPEKGDRCTVCFDNRLEVSVKKTIELHQDKFTTTLLISPLKSQEKLEKIGNSLANKYNLEFIFKDYRSGQGMHLQGEAVKQNNLYRQNYCGCMFALNKQREQQDKLCDELLSPINGQILPESIESRLELYKLRNKLESDGKPYHIIKQRFLNYRLLNGKVVIDNKVIPSYFIYFSTIQNGKCTGKIEFYADEIYYLNKNEVKFITLDTFNKYANTTYKTVLQLMWSPTTIQTEILLRNSILCDSYDLSCLIILDTIPPQKKIEITCNSKLYEDIKEKII